MKSIDSHKLVHLFFILITILTLGSCKDPEDDTEEPAQTDNSTPIGTDWTFNTPYYVQDPIIPSDNPMKEEAIELGRYLFWEKKLSGDNTQSCASCHLPEYAFTDPNQFSIGIDGLLGTRNSMHLTNLAFVNNAFFWDGRAGSLEAQAHDPVTNPIEMHNTWDNAIAQLQDTELYPELFAAAFGDETIDSIRATKAIAQFVRTMTSYNSKYDKYKVGQAMLNESELLGMQIWSMEGGDPDVVQGGQFGADCFHCHPIAGGQFRDNFYHNNGLDATFTDLGRFYVTELSSDSARFKVPSLRNIEYTAPYMHDGRFNTLEEVVEHYNSGGHTSYTIDPFMKNTSGGLDLSPQKKQALIDFMKSLSDPDFLTNPDFSDPH